MLLVTAVSSFLERHVKKTIFNNFLDCGIPNRADSTKRIRGGGKTEIGEYPWQVSLSLYLQVDMSLVVGLAVNLVRCPFGRGCSVTGFAIEFHVVMRIKTH